MPFDPSTPAGPSPADFAGIPLFINMTVSQPLAPSDNRTISITFGAVYDESVTTGEAHTMWRLRSPYMTALSVIASTVNASDIPASNPSASLSFSERFTTNRAGFSLPPPNNLPDEIPFILDIEFGDLGRRQYRVTPIELPSGTIDLVYASAMNGTLMGSAEEFVPAPMLVGATGLMVLENAPIGTVIGVAATPQFFPDGTPRWLFGNGTNSSPPFGITADTGELTVIGALSAATQDEYTRTIALEQGGASASVDVQIAVLVFTPPASLTPAALSVVERAAVGTDIGVAATPQNFPDGTQSWRIINASGDAVVMDGLFAIDAITGRLLVGAAIPPLADGASYTVRVRLTQSGVSAETVVTVTVTAAPPIVVDPAATRPRHFAAWTISFPDIASAEGLDAAVSPMRLWTGDGDLVLGTETYAGVGALVSVGQLHAELSQPVRQATIGISLRAIAADRRRLFLSDPGSRRVEIGQVISTDGGNWTRIPRTFRGRLSSPRIGDDIYQIDVVTTIADIDRGRPQFLSDEHQQARHPGDLGLEYMREFAGGVDVRWPP